MIDKFNTVLILGAGSSQDFGYPLGDELKKHVIRVLSDNEFHDELVKGYGFRPGMQLLIQAFVEDLRNDVALTIDRFLAKHRKEYQKLGKVAIVKAITRCEDKGIFQNSNSWYRLLYQIISGYPNLENIALNKISILTFNYDRSLEYFLFTQLLNDYGNQYEEAIISLLKKIPIIHLHGRVNMLPWEDHSTGYPYGERHFVPNIFDVAEKMILPIDEHKIFNDAHQIISQADVIYFLGFGFDQSNLRKLNPDLISNCENVFGTCHNLPLAYQETINSQFDSHKINFHSKTVFDFMMNVFNPHRQAESKKPNVTII